MEQVQHIGRSKVRVPCAFPDGVGKIPNNPVIAAAVVATLNGGPRARFLKGGWRENDDGMPIYRLYGRRGGCITISVSPDPTDLPIDLQSVDPWTFVESLTPFTTDVALATLAQFMVVGPPALSNAGRQTRWQATAWSAAFSSSWGVTALHRSWTSGQRFANGHPARGCVGEAGSPLRRTLSSPRRR